MAIDSGVDKSSLKTVNHVESATPSSLVYRDELKYFRKIIAAYRAYYAYSMAALNQKERDFHANLSLHHQSLLGELYLNKLAQIRHCVLANARFIREVVPEGTENQLAHDESRNENPTQESKNPDTKQLIMQYMRETGEVEIEKVRSTLRQLVREWSAEVCVLEMILYHVFNEWSLTGSG